MSDYQKNRFEFVDDDSSSDAAQEGSRPRIYLDETEVVKKSRTNFKRAIIFGGALILLVGLSSGLYYLYHHQLWFFKDQVIELPERILGEAEGTELKERYYYPTGNFSSRMQKAIAYYQENNRHQAKREFENILLTESASVEKAAAATFLGIMALETERFAQAKHHFLKALKYQEDYLPALVNLAVSERRLANNVAAEEYARRAYELAPNDSKINILLGNIQSDRSDFGGATESYEKGLKENPDDAYLLYNLALAHLRQNRLESALRNFNRIMELPEGGEIAVQSAAHIAQIYYNQNRYVAAADYLERAVKLAPGNGKYLYNLGVIYLRMGKERQAARYFKKALSAGSNEPAVLRNLALSFQKMKQPSLAIEALNKALYGNPDDVATLFQLADLLYEEQELLAAAEKLRRIVNITPGDRNTQDALLKLSAVYLELERYAKAEEVIRQSIKLDPRAARNWYHLGIVYNRAGRADEAIRAWQKALNSDADSEQPVVLPRPDERLIRKALAALYRKNGAYDQALKQYRLILAANSRPPVVEDDPEINLLLGQTFLDMEETTAAIRELTLVEKSRNATTDERRTAFMELARAYSFKPEHAEIDIAKAYIYRAARLSPGDNEIRLLQSQILLKSESSVDREQALEILMALTSSETTPGFASRAYNLLGFAHYKNGDYTRSLHSFDYALQLDPSNRLAFDNQRMALNALEKSQHQ